MNACCSDTISQDSLRGLESLTTLSNPSALRGLEDSSKAGKGMYRVSRVLGKKRQERVCTCQIYTEQGEDIRGRVCSSFYSSEFQTSQSCYGD